MNVVHVTPGNWRGMVQTKLRNLRSGTQTEYRFRSEDKAERVTFEQHEMEFIYESDGQYHFMNTGNFEQMALEADILGDAVKFLVPNSRIQVEFHEGKPMGVSLPKTIDLKIVETARVHFVERAGNRGRARYAGRMRGLPGPAETVDWELEPWSRLHFRSTPSLWPGVLYHFDGLFTCEETAEGTCVRHREAVSLRPPLAWVVDPLLRDWLARDTAREMARLKALLER